MLIFLLFIVGFTSVYVSKTTSQNTSYIHTGKKIYIDGYIFHPKYYYSFRIFEVPYRVKGQLYTHQGDYMIGHYTLGSKNRVMTIVDYAGAPSEGFHAVVSGSEIHSSLAAVLAKAMTFEMMGNASEIHESIPKKYKPPIPDGKGHDHVAVEGRKKYWIPAS